MSPENKTLESLAYSSLVRPHLEYAAPARDSYLTEDISELKSVQLRATRFAHNDYLHSTYVTGLLDSLNWPLLSVKNDFNSA